jgi:hypothetical protein
VSSTRLPKIRWDDRSGGLDIGVPEVIALEEQGLAYRLGQGVREAIAEVQARGMARALAKVAVCRSSQSGLLDRYRFDDGTRDVEQVIDPAAGHRVACSIDDGSDLDIGCRRDADGSRRLDGDRETLGVVLIAKDGDQR